MSVNLSGRVRIGATEDLGAAIFSSVGLFVSSGFVFGPELTSDYAVPHLSMTGRGRRSISMRSIPPVGWQAARPALS